MNERIIRHERFGVRPAEARNQSILAGQVSLTAFIHDE